MAEFGLKLMSELRDPSALVDQARDAEERGMDFVAISDHIHPWLGDHDHSPAAWPVLGAIAERTERVEIATGITCPIMRYHPVIVAQMAATVATMSGGRFTLAVGAGERLNEHVVGAGWPPIDVRHEMLSEAVSVMRQLWSGGFSTYRGEHFTAEDVRIYDLPDDPIPVVVGVSGQASLDLAAEVDADGIMAIEPDASIVKRWVDSGGDAARTYTEVAFAVAADADQGLDLAHRFFRFSAPGWSVMSELPNPLNFDAATASVRPEDMADAVPHGPDAKPYVEAVSAFLDAGFSKVSFVPVGDDLDRFWGIVAEVVAELGGGQTV
jgi:G6PDH family F420-dependent oxidoreductase